MSLIKWRNPLKKTRKKSKNPYLGVIKDNFFYYLFVTIFSCKKNVKNDTNIFGFII